MATHEPRHVAKFPPPWLVWVAAGLSVVTFAALVSYQSEHLNNLGGTPLLGERIKGYDKADVVALLQTLGDDGISKYRIATVVFDTLFLLANGAACSLLMLWLSFPGRVLARGFRLAMRRFLYFLPLATLVFDGAENRGIFLLLSSEPAGPPVLVVTITSMLTQVKLILYAATYFILFVLLSNYLLPLAARKWRLEAKE